ncbi:MAG: peptide-methionine (S)-S-oxide reductase [Candidatus Sungbacteria bacterium RIFCSPLOWO2_02_FULL_51_17]|uniref:Peptide methionine sulfoxide reductase MsrA n=1 Tax=Candidatus Sungbacteria bacterium RIFCSPHIGHO2_02_FULL_51_29 TaxID=1802273 RepID=A0A1G2KWF4_9BACT|nr:MAG: peptide-methionine (S)-S-oxide reductase [Candidatus Sungbacteria bacterium RIFCSPHIGHO2_01_FULL_51_22]OHA03768.1 MAG: peptide-methionine (S)-S-oxide reductase [Candidatus Sungbacteria bacterium RIFCSPHIGHO2_02_FULL_51_29]OHA06585.1 MAG: peptide-methionine (S)-S-oxide reductase [Candidatus Sungbacteria bacterium RIFCSPLOWO2_01_FULL_51_34]OHA10526.1 MAG: peptide-methionine (S)-S-oxide reductase [Candidatus Sungbacteria bacterium RIFCSPLOWO2_02_FULL_51_17]
MEYTKEIAVFGGGCFWCTEAIFRMLKGVYAVDPGYAGGIIDAPTYEDVSSGRTGHAEVIRIEFDPAVISYENLLTVFFATHDPTTPNRQGADVGSQYRSVIFYTSERQQELAVAVIGELNASHKEGGTVITEVAPLTTFFPAEEYHREYYAKNPRQSYCEVIINPKLKKVQAAFAELLKNAVNGA